MKSVNLIQPDTTLTLQVPDVTQTRLDRFLVEQLPDYSRSYLQKLITQGHVRINDTVVTKAHSPLRPGMTVTLYFPPPPALLPSQKDLSHLDIPIIYENEQFLVINKPAGLITHAPTKDSPVVTLVDWLVTRFAELATVGSEERPGIVHRLDKDTSGLMLVARTPYAHMTLSDLFKSRAIKKSYLAVVEGHPPKNGTIDFRIARHPTDNKMTHIAPHGRDAVTRYHVIEYFDNAALVHVFPLTGRTHQIRVHFAAIGHPLVGDQLYGKSSSLIARHALHAYSLEFTFNDTDYSFTAALPEDFKQLQEKLK